MRILLFFSGQRILIDMDRLVEIYQTMLLGISTIAASITLSLGFLSSQKPSETIRVPSSQINPTVITSTPEVRQDTPKKPATSFTSLASEFATSSGTQTRLNRIYNIAFYDIDAAKEKSRVKSGTISATFSTAIQHILNVANIKPSLAESFSVLLMAPQDPNAKSTKVAIDKSGKIVPVEQRIGPKENSQLNMLHTYILLRSTMSPEELAITYIRTLSLVIVNSLSADQFKSYMQLRNMNSKHIESVYSKYNQFRNGDPVLKLDSWKEEPDQDFAEVFTTLYADPNHVIKTKYGQYSGQTKAWFTQNIDPLFIQK